MNRFQSSVTNDPGCLWQLSRRRRAAPRRGNTIVLVVGILVLLVIIATAYISRTHAGRVTALATQRATLRDDNAQVIADSIASEIAEALFVRPLAPALGVPGGIPDSNAPRLPIPPDALRYDFDLGFPANFAPHQVVAQTNWPDGAGDPNWPDGAGNVGGGGGSPALDAEGNSLGNPGQGDTRWLADIEPLRITLPGPDGMFGTADDVVAFSHWRHMSNIARPDNGWRIVGDISNVEGLLVTDLSIPAEQQLAVRSDSFNGSTGLPSVSVNFFGRWQNWLGGPGFGGYPVAYTNPLQIPPNFLHLKDLDGDGVPHNFGDRPQDEFIPGTARHTVSLVLADADGDGFTDSFWLLAPTMIERGIRQIVAVRIIDNSAMLNANVATRFVLNDILFGDASKTRGATPTDLALVGQKNTDAFAAPSDTWNVGFFDHHANWEGNPPPLDGDGSIFFPGFLGSADSDDSPYGTSVVRYRDARWANDGERDFLSEIGVDGNPMFVVDAELERAAGRLAYWRLAGLSPFSASGGLTPFTLADELELRMYDGNNYPWVLSRFERAVNTIRRENAFLHSTNDQFNNHIRVESSEYLDQLSNRELLFDSRRKLTLFSGARNDLMPPWLRWRWDLPAGIPPGGVDEANFLAQARRKLDLREPDFVIGQPPPPGERTFRERLAPTLLLALTDGFGDPMLPTHAGQSYFGDYNTSDTTPGSVFGKLRLLAAGWSANILAYRDSDPLGVNPAPLAEAIPLPEVDGVPEDGTIQFLGLERQPFLLEAFIGHVHASKAIPPILPPPDDPPQFFGFPGNYVDSSHEQTTIVVVQIANPFDEPINLMGYTLRVFGQNALLPNVDLPPASEQTPATAIFYAIVDQFSGVSDFRDQWLDFLDLANTDHPSGTQIENVNAINTNWSIVRDAYVSVPAGQNAIELLREDTSLGVPYDVIIDRFDYDEDHSDHDEFRDVVAALPAVPTAQIPDPDSVPPVLEGIRIDDDDFWVTWARVTRAWGNDFDTASVGTIEPNERAPRFVFARQDVTISDDSFPGDPSGEAGPFVGDAYDDGEAPDLPWFVHSYQDASGTRQTNRKPTFFDMNRANDPAFPLSSYPDKGFYQFRGALQMLQKNGDFEQVGELLNVWLFGHELEFSGAGDYQQTTTTFSEFMSDSSMAGTGTAVNRLRVRPAGTISPIIGKGGPMNLLDPLHAVPALPAGLRVLDAFVCDGLGVNSPSAGEFLNANGFSGRATPGLININTAPVEVMRALPHMTRLVHEIASPATNFYVRLPEAIVRYRERFGDPTSTNAPPAYGDRGATGGFVEGLRPERGYASIGELMLLTKPAQFVPPVPLLEPNENWQVDFAALRPAVLGPPGAGVESTQISTDVNDVFDPITMSDVPDQVAQDVEEQNLLFAGISNLITTRSDMFTVYFKVRSFRQNPVTRIWDATDPEFIVDDSRYVMLVDRSEVNRPTDKPKILYLEKLPK